MAEERPPSSSAPDLNFEGAHIGQIDLLDIFGSTWPGQFVKLRRKRQSNYNLRRESREKSNLVLFSSHSHFSDHINFRFEFFPPLISLERERGKKNGNLDHFCLI